MKLQILQLKAHDDHISAREKLGWVKADRVVLVWPRHGQVLQRRLDLRMLQRKADEQGLQLGLVSHDPQVRDHARRLHIPVFESTEVLPEERWRTSEQSSPYVQASDTSDDDSPRDEPLEPPDTPSRRADRRGSILTRITSFTLGLAAFLALGAALGPSATLIATPVTENRRAQGVAQLDSGLQQPDPDAGAIPARLVRTEVTGELRARTTGQSTQPADRARGTVVFRNLTDDAQSIPAGTSVRTIERPQVRFVTVEAAEIPAGSGELVEVQVEAAQAGLAGNVDAGQIQAVDGPLGLSLEVQNPDPLSGGTERSIPAVAERDQRQLMQALQDQLLSQGASELRQQLTAGESVASSSIRMDRVLSQRYDRQPGEFGASLGLELTLRVSGQAYRTDDLRALAHAQLRAEEPAGWSAVPGSQSVQVNQTSGTQADGVEIHYTAQWTSYRELPQAAIVRAARGREPGYVQARLEQQFELEDLQVRPRPSWLPRLPFLDVRIELLYPWQAGP